jgi:F0F1-type ATP synthase membrane subunit a
LNYFFGNQTIKLKYGHKASVFEKSILDFQKMDKKNVQNRKPKTLFPMNFLPFLYILFLNLLKDETGRPKKAGIFSQPILFF